MVDDGKRICMLQVIILMRVQVRFGLGLALQHKVTTKNEFDYDDVKKNAINNLVMSQDHRNQMIEFGERSWRRMSVSGIW